MNNRISICMAVYNGGGYLEQQLDSIFEQSLQVDEIIVVDDCSSDDSASIIQRFINKLPIVYIKNEINIGVIKTFERALNKATGDILILCDQDDVWQKDKVKYINECLTKNGGLCISNYHVIDENGKKTGCITSFIRSDFSVLKTISKNRFIGCCMAFDKNVLQLSLPFPENLPMHDSWIGLNAAIYSKITVIKEELVFYRRHGENVTGIRGSISEMLHDRYHLIVNLIYKLLKK